ncbi:MAG: cytochrome C biogenesis protein [Acidobacteria bacterium]|nr:MAG: cytochrome C biogenesis protein [Acidobacteriota bacterium]PYV00295.1 MAG: cytochrome C biogenesis protein [Acidobacteriota bacterium]
MSEFGNFCLLLAFCLGLYALLASVLGAVQKQHRIVRSAERAALAACGSIALALSSLVYLLVTSDFSVSHVASASNRALPVYYKIAALWGAHDGSLLLWVFVTSIFSGIVIYQNRFRYRDMMPYVVAVLMVNLSFFLCLNLFLSNPFNQLVQANADGTLQKFIPQDGRGLNPLLQYWAMVIHPPILYLGFIGFVVPFAFAFAALVTKQLGDSWIRTIRRWTLVPWMFLGAGLILGGKWAYVEMGWGGYWGWDPVENASLMPWLTGTAFLHSVIVQERKGMLKVWNVFLIMITYLLGVFGTFITRSGVINSVHAFADSSLGPFFLYYMSAVFFVSMYLIIDRLPYLKSERPLDSVLSRESAFLFNNLVLLVACFAVFWGTMFPVLSEWVQGQKMTVGPPFFNNVNIPIGLFLLFLTGVGPLFAWRKTSVESLKKAFFWPVIFSVPFCAALMIAGMRDFYAVVSFTLCVFVLITVVREFYKGASVRAKNTGESFLSAIVNLTLKNKRRYGGYIVHVAIVVIFVGLTGNAFNKEVQQKLSKGESMHIGRYMLRMVDYREADTPNYQLAEVKLEAYKDGKLIRTMTPEKRLYKAGDQQTTTEVELYSTPKEDLYVVFSGVANGGKGYEIHAFVNPLVFWVWFGAAIMVFGTLVTLLPDRKGAFVTPQLSFSEAAGIGETLRIK